MNKSRIMKVETLFLYFSLNTNVCGKLEVAFYVMVFGEICVRSDIFFFSKFVCAQVSSRCILYDAWNGNLSHSEYKRDGTLNW